MSAAVTAKPAPVKHFPMATTASVLRCATIFGSSFFKRSCNRRHLLYLAIAMPWEKLFTPVRDRPERPRALAATLSDLSDRSERGHKTGLQHVFRHALTPGPLRVRTRGKSI